MSSVRYARRDAGGGDAATYRAFGRRAEDLDLDFDAADEPGVVTALLRACSTGDRDAPEIEAELWSMSVGERIDALLSVLEATGVAALHVRVRCAECGDVLEVEGALADLRRLERERRPRSPTAIEVDGVPTALRRPTGEDQRDWASGPASMERSLADTIVRTLVVDGAERWRGRAVPEDVAREVAERLRDVDPLVSLPVDVACPRCGHAALHDVDVQAWALHRLRATQSALLSDVHRLAASYHWGEGAIVDLPPWRRARYVALLDGEGPA